MEGLPALATGTTAENKSYKGGNGDHDLTHVH